jgi:hypothetical protein
MRERINLPLSLEHQILNADFWKYRPRNVTVVHQIQIGAGKLSTPNLLLQYSLEFYWKRPNVLLRNRISQPSFLHNKQPADSDLFLRSNPSLPKTLLQTLAAQLAWACHKITQNLHGTITLRCFDRLLIILIIITYQPLVPQCVSRNLVMIYVFRHLCWCHRQCHLG